MILKLFLICKHPPVYVSPKINTICEKFKIIYKTENKLIGQKVYNEKIL